MELVNTFYRETSSTKLLLKRQGFQHITLTCRYVQNPILDGISRNTERISRNTERWGESVFPSFYLLIPIDIKHTH